MKEINSGNVLFGDASKVQVGGRGHIYFFKNDGNEGSIEDVYYVPKIKSSILSLGQLLRNGYSVLMKDRKLHLKDNNGRLLACIEMA